MKEDHVKSLTDQGKGDKKNRYSGLSIWALAFGCVIGWGAFVMPGNNFLPEAGPVGTMIGLVIAAVICMVVCVNYSYLAQQYPEANGSYVYVRYVLGEDHAFISAWSLLLAYISIFWSNAAAVALLARYIIGDVLMWGFHYRLFKYDVWCGEVLFTLFVILFFGLITSLFKRFADILRMVLAAALFVCVIALFIGICIKTDITSLFSPAFSTGEARLVQVMNIAVFAPFLFIGFETVTQTVTEVKFPVRRIFIYAQASIFCGMLVYILLAFTGAAGVPKRYADWSAYIADIDNLSGIESLPVFYSAKTILGNAGLALVAVAAFSAMATGILGFHRAAARVMKNMAVGKLMPERFAEVDEQGVPVKVSLLIMLISLPVPFLGRTALGWTADVSTLTAAVVYAYVSLCVWMKASAKKDKILGTAGVILTVILFLLLLLPNIFANNVLATESYFLLMLWSIVGLVYYWAVFQKDREDRFGHSTIMWMLLLFMLLFSTHVWVRLQTEAEAKVEDADLSRLLMKGSLVQLVIIIIALVIMYNIFIIMLKRRKELDVKIIQSEERSKAKSDFLSNMSHDIRTPMNAIIGFTDLALLDVNNVVQTEEYLRKIKASSAHLLSLINDVLEMSRIESGKFELHEEQVNLPELLHDLNTIIIGQVEAKQQELFMDAIGITDEDIICDKLRLNQVLLNLVSNAIKYTPSGGKISIRIKQISSAENGKADYELRIKDNGIGMSQEFAEKIFDAFERENTSTVSGIQGTGLGMAITRNIVELMGGTISVQTEKGKGSEFIVAMTFAIGKKTKKDYSIESLKGVRALVVDDDFDTCDILTNMLMEFGVESDWTTSGREAVLRAKQAKQRGRSYGLYILDWRMPDLSGIEAAKQITMEVSEEARIVLMTAYDKSAIGEEAIAAGIKGFCSKPVFTSDLYETLVKIMHEGDPEEEEKQDAGQRIEASFEGKRLLLVDDIMINREIAKEILSMYGFVVEEADDGTVAVQKVEEAEAGYYDVLLMDVQMPKMNGYDATKAIRAFKDQDKANVPIFAMTANAFDEDRKNAEAAGMNGHISKPINTEMLVRTLGDYFEKH